MNPVTSAELIELLEQSEPAEGAEPAQVIIRKLPTKRTKKKQPVEPPPLDFSWSEMAGNIPSSAAQWAKDSFYGLGHLPSMETGKALVKTAIGAAQSRIPGEQEYEQQYFDPIAGVYGDRYGSWEQFKKTAMEDPVGTLSDVALAPTLAGATAKTAGLVAKGAGALTKGQMLSQLGERAGQVGSGLLATGAALDPLNVAYNTAVRPVARTAAKVAIDPNVPADIFTRGAKWPTKKSQGAEYPRDLSNIALETGVRPTIRGSKKLDRLVQDVTTELNTKLDAATEAGSLINRDALFKYFDDAIAKYGSPTRMSGKRNRQLIESMRDRYIQNFDEMTGGETLLTPKQVQDFKIDIYEDLRDMGAYDSLKTTAKGKKAGLKAAARAAKEELEVVAPGIDEINRRLGDLRKLKEAMPNPTGRLGRLNFMGLGAPMRTGAGAAIGGAIGGPVGAKVGMGLGGLATAMDTPSVKFATAEKLYKALNNPILDPRTKSTLVPALRQILSELEQQSQANPELFAE